MKIFLIPAFVILVGLNLAMPSLSMAENLSATEITQPALQVPTLQTSGYNVATEKNSPTSQVQAGLANYLPIATPQLTPGDVVTKAIDHAQTTSLPQPIFLIGSDECSKTWLEKNRDQLKQIHAIGLLIQANTPEDIQVIQTLGQGLTIIPAPANELIQRYSLTHYPVLITNEEVSQ